MKILQVMSSCSRDSGVAQIIMNYYRNLCSNVKFDFLLFWDIEDSFKDEIENCGGRVYFTGKPNVMSLKAYIVLLKDFFSKHAHEYEIIHLHELYLSPIILFLARKYGIKVRIAHSHTAKLSDCMIKEIRNRILFLGTRFFATHYFACSKQAAIAAFGMDVLLKESFFIIKNAIDCKKFYFSNDDRKMIRSKYSIGDALVIGNVGRLSAIKNQMFLLDVFAELCKMGIDTRLLFIGNGYQYDELNIRAKKNGLDDKIIFLGVQKDVGKFLSAMDIFVFPSISEGLGMALIEAQSNGLKCIVSDAIPDEAKILPNFQKLQLSKAPSFWAQSIINSNIKRCDEVEKYIRSSGYEIGVAQDELLGIYYCIADEN